ncbi:oligopeptidase A domain protein [Burkholderia pseudomallei MSHR456]|nr:oligopeptidase A domain protein [Burkholderia pseudomallei MSHR456]
MRPNNVDMTRRPPPCAAVFRPTRNRNRQGALCPSAQTPTRFSISQACPASAKFAPNT